VASLHFVHLPPDAFRVDGHVRFVNVEGGCWVIDAADGTRYEPVNLPEAFRSDGLPVRAALKPRPDLASICMVGEIVELLSIRRRIEAVAYGG
jgi:inhibitor of cysteine peptidase